MTENIITKSNPPVVASYAHSTTKVTVAAIYSDFSY